MALQNLADSRDQVNRNPALENVSESPCHTCRVHESIIFEHGKEYHLSWRTEIFEVMGSFNSVEYRHRYVQHDQVGFQVKCGLN